MYWPRCSCCASCVLMEKWIVLHMPWFIYLRGEFLPSGARLETASIGPLSRSIRRASGAHGALVAVLATLESAADNANALGKNEFRFPLLFIRISEQNLHQHRTPWRYSWPLSKQLILYEYWKTLRRIGISGILLHGNTIFSFFSASVKTLDNINRRIRLKLNLMKQQKLKFKISDLQIVSV